MAKAFETMRKLDLELAVRDSIDALRAVRELPEVEGPLHPARAARTLPVRAPAPS